jgi:hypothetical protein
VGEGQKKDDFIAIFFFGGILILPAEKVALMASNAVEIVPKFGNPFPKI